MLSRNWSKFNKKSKASFDTYIPSNYRMAKSEADKEKKDIIMQGQGNYTKADLDAVDERYGVGKYYDEDRYGRSIY